MANDRPSAIGHLPSSIPIRVRSSEVIEGDELQPIRAPAQPWHPASAIRCSPLAEEPASPVGERLSPQLQLEAECPSNPDDEFRPFPVRSRALVRGTLTEHES